MCASWRVGPFYIHSRQFETRLLETARQSMDVPDGVVIRRTLELASTFDLSLTAAGIAVRRLQEHT